MYYRIYSVLYLIYISAIIFTPYATGKTLLCSQRFHPATDILCLFNKEEFFSYFSKSCFIVLSNECKYQWLNQGGHGAPTCKRAHRGKGPKDISGPK